MYLVGVHLTGCVAYGRVPRGCVSHWVCTSLGVHISVYLIGVTRLKPFGFFNLGFLGKSFYILP
jgi:hypothetical protein